VEAKLRRAGLARREAKKPARGRNGGMMAKKSGEIRVSKSLSDRRVTVYLIKRDSEARDSCRRCRMRLSGFAVGK
jgi:hypothetical protein